MRLLGVPSGPLVDCCRGVGLGMCSGLCCLDDVGEREANVGILSMAYGYLYALITPSVRAFVGASTLRSEFAYCAHICALCR